MQVDTTLIDNKQKMLPVSKETHKAVKALALELETTIDGAVQYLLAQGKKK